MKREINGLVEAVKEVAFELDRVSKENHRLRVSKNKLEANRDLWRTRCRMALEEVRRLRGEVTSESELWHDPEGPEVLLAAVREARDGPDG